MVYVAQKTIFVVKKEDTQINVNDAEKKKNWDFKDKRLPIGITHK